MLKPLATSALLLASFFVSSTLSYAVTPSPGPVICDSKGRCTGIKEQNDTVNPDKDGNGSSNNPNPGSTTTTDPLDQRCKAHGIVGGKAWCLRRKSGTATTSPNLPTETQLRKVVAKLKLPDPTPRFGPDPSVNEWNMLVVGYPIWLWTDQPTTLTTTAHQDGLTFRLTATWQSTTFTMGAGQTKTCAATTVYPPHLDKPGRPSPTCGYVYEVASPKGHPYTVSADTHWQIDWATNGYTGTFDHIHTGSRTLDVGELQSMING